MRKLFISFAATALLAAATVHAKTPVCNLNLNPAMTDKIQAVEIAAPGVLDVCLSENEQLLFLESARDNNALNIEAKQSFGVIFFSSQGESVPPTKFILYTLNEGDKAGRKNALNRYELVVTATSLQDQHRLNVTENNAFLNQLKATKVKLTADHHSFGTGK